MQEEAKEVVCSNPDDQPRLGLLLVILAIIFMKDNVLPEGTEFCINIFIHSLHPDTKLLNFCFILGMLWDALKRLGVIKG
jgi:hypothetical protein